MIREIIDESLSGIILDRPGQAAVWNGIQQIEAAGEGYGLRKVRPYRRPLRVVITVLLLILALSVLCIAAELPARIMDLLEPVNKAAVYDGIEMKTVSAVADDDSVMIIYT